MAALPKGHLARKKERITLTESILISPICRQISQVDYTAVFKGVARQGEDRCRSRFTPRFSQRYRGINPLLRNQFQKRAASQGGVVWDVSRFQSYSKTLTTFRSVTGYQLSIFFTSRCTTLGWFPATFFVSHGSLRRSNSCGRFSSRGCVVLL